MVSVIRCIKFIAVICMEALALVLGLMALTLGGSMLLIVMASLALIMLEQTESAAAVAVPYAVWRREWGEMIETFH